MQKILFLSPQPFFQERGTPIAVKLAAGVLAEAGYAIDLVTYHEGESTPIQGVTHHRCWAPSWLRNIRPGISVKKLVCDLFFLFKALTLVMTNREKYRLVHAVEESVFIAWFFKIIFGLPYVYDMDSSLSLQLTEKWEFLTPLRGAAEWLERLAVKRAVAVVAVCDSLAEVAVKLGAKKVDVLYDVSLLAPDCNDKKDGDEDLRRTCGLKDDAKIALYVGNLERYQGVDLLLESVASISSQLENASVILIGGNAKDIEIYKQKVITLGLVDRVFVLGPRPVDRLGEYLLQADVLVSPRIKGNNTPMKIYSYLHSGVAVLATNLPTHTQVLNEEISVLAPPNPKDFGIALLSLMASKELRARLGAQARQVAEAKYTFRAFRQKLLSLYSELKIFN